MNSLDIPTRDFFASQFSQHSMPIATLGVRFVCFPLFSQFLMSSTSSIARTDRLALYIWNNMQIEETVFIDVWWFSYFAYQSHCRVPHTYADNLEANSFRGADALWVNIMSVKLKIKIVHYLHIHRVLTSHQSSTRFISRATFTIFYIFHPQSRFLVTCDDDDVAKKK